MLARRRRWDWNGLEVRGSLEVEDSGVGGLLLRRAWLGEAKMEGCLVVVGWMGEGVAVVCFMPGARRVQQVVGFDGSRVQAASFPCDGDVARHRRRELV